MRRVGRPTVRDEPRKLIAIRLDAKVLSWLRETADPIITFAELVGQKNVIAGTDCDLGGRVHPQIA
jgi:hypothetical protein